MIALLLSVFGIGISPLTKEEQERELREVEREETEVFANSYYEVLRRLPFLVARDFSLDLHGAHSTGVLVRPHQTAHLRLLHS